MKKAGLPD